MDETDVGYRNCGLPIIDGAHSGNWLTTFPRDLSTLALNKAYMESTLTKVQFSINIEAAISR